ncbi:TonB-dependent receptor [Marinoscillum sp. MHG1-6]|uniref:TonB-dependent receptor n=1 Tax=Marinoscillum sp. MHG1-6 TaxID=2959627 RepID=UPI0021572510|nr:TonB-dependent receptor [Marinoscillum sp. MHG1-6]
MKNLIAVALLFIGLSSFAQDKYTLSGYVKDASNGESLIGATVLIKELKTGNVTNFYGFYSITMVPGKYTVTFSYVGYESKEIAVDLSANKRLDLEMELESEQLQEVVITGHAENANVSEMEMSTNELDIKTINKIPAFLGEVDVIKSLQLLPGVTTVGEGASGFNVRGGSVGQNLVLLDEAPVYNSSHMFGFFSVFNPDAVKDVKLYKGGTPAEYGGRLSSILDVRMKEGNNKRYEVNGGVGTIFSRMAVEGPIVKDKASFILAGRRSYIDVLARPFLKNNDLDGVGLYFYDLTFKSNYNINPKNRIYLSGYIGRDDFNFDERQGFDWGNKTVTFRWNHLYSDKIFSNTTLFLSNYDYSFQVGEDDDDEFRWKSRILTYDLKEQFTYFINTRNELSFGGEAILYRFIPANVYGASDGEGRDFSLEERKSLEYAAYVGNEQKVTDAFTVEYGARLSGFSYLGDGTVYYYQEGEPGKRKPLTGMSQAGNFENIKTYYNLEPRASMKYEFDESMSVKASYQKMTQYIHLVSNTAATLPTDVWTPSTNNLKPQIGHQVALGVFKNFFNNQFETSVEGYYKRNKNQVDYIDGAELYINSFLEGDLLSGRGRAYGLEFFVKKPAGRWNGWISYTLGRTELQVDGVNSNKWYPTRYDQTHNMKLTAAYDVSKRLSISSNFTYITGTPTTLPSYRFEIQGITIPGVEGRNNSRIPDYHRLDVSANLKMRSYKPNGKKKKLEDYWVFTVYNLYARENPFAIYFGQGQERLDNGALAGTSAYQTAILGTMVPAVSYNFKF